MGKLKAMSKVDASNDFPVHVWVRNLGLVQQAAEEGDAKRDEENAYVGYRKALG